MKPAVNKTLIIRLSSIGDVILASPLIRVLRKNFPTAQIDFLVKSAYAALVRYNPYLTNIIELDPAGGLRHLRALRGRIRRERYDLVLDIQGNFRSVYLRRAVAPHLLTVRKRRLARFVLINFKWNVYRSAPPVSIRYLEALLPYGIKDDSEGVEIFVPQEISDRVQGHLSKAGQHSAGPTIGICPGARHENKAWPPDRFAELALSLMKEEQATVLLFGGKEEWARCKVVEERIQKECVAGATILNLAGGFSILETAAAMDQCDVVVANDSGLLHLAAARKRKVVAIFGPTVREFGFFPYGTESVVIEREGLYCRPCTHLGRRDCPEGHFRCMREISVQEVLSAVKAFLPVAVT